MAACWLEALCGLSRKSSGSFTRKSGAKNPQSERKRPQTYANQDFRVFARFAAPQTLILRFSCSDQAGMAVARSVTCKSLELGLDMVANQSKTAPDFQLDEEIAESKQNTVMTPTSLTCPSFYPSSLLATKEQTRRVLQLQQE